jgi:hypothetical protein
MAEGLTWGIIPNDELILDEPEDDGKYRPPPAQCLHCGRFVGKMSSRHYYTGMWDDVIIMWNCSRCGECEMSTV